MLASHEHVPKLSNLVEFLYIPPGHLSIGRSSEIISLCVGVQQGCPLAPLLFCLVLKEITNKFRHNDITSLWYLDYGHFAGPSDSILNTLGIIMDEGPPLGLHSNLGKCTIFGNDLQNSPKGIP